MPATIALGSSDDDEDHRGRVADGLSKLPGAGAAGNDHRCRRPARGAGPCDGQPEHASVCLPKMRPVLSNRRSGSRSPLSWLFGNGCFTAADARHAEVEQRVVDAEHHVVLRERRERAVERDVLIAEPVVDVLRRADAVGVTRVRRELHARQEEHAAAARLRVVDPRELRGGVVIRQLHRSRGRAWRRRARSHRAWAPRRRSPASARAGRRYHRASLDSVTRVKGVRAVCGASVAVVRRSISSRYVAGVVMISPCR